MNLTPHCLQESVAANQIPMAQTHQKLGFWNHNTIIFWVEFCGQQSQKLFLNQSTLHQHIFLSSYSRIWSETSRTTVFVESSFLKSDCLSDKNLFSLINSETWSCTIFSKIFIGIGKELLGLKSLESVFRCPLHRWGILLVFQHFVIYPSFSLKLKFLPNICSGQVSQILKV